MKATLEDIAALSGTSVASVSRVINASSPVSKDLEQRVKQAMKELGFEPKQPKERTKPYILAFIAPGVVDPTGASTIYGAQEEAKRLGLCLVVIDVTEKQGYPEQNLQLFTHLSFDGVIIDHARLNPEELFQAYKLGNIPIAVISKQVDSPHFYCINSDRESGMYQATKYLLSLNHRDIAYLGADPDLYISQNRLQGITRALAEADLSLKDGYYRLGNTTIDGGFESATRILSQADARRPSAFLCYNDLVAIGAMHAIRSFGLNVPDDISVVGFNENYFTPHTNPPLTTVSQPKTREGQMAVQKIYNILHGYDTNRSGFTLLECPLVVRDSTSPCKRSDNIEFQTR
ncbi:MAG: LacI family transcriptional regulator [bacterium]|nr:LacI family transcriptional regulator [bacterium]